MHVAALITWLLTALSGFYMLATWIARGGLRQQQGGTSRLPAPVIFGHFALAVVGLLVWIAYLATGRGVLAWTAFAILLPIALLGFTMLARWIPVYRTRSAAAGAAASSTGAGGVDVVTAGAGEVPAERHFPVGVVLGHGALAVITLVLVLISAILAGSN